MMNWRNRIGVIAAGVMALMLIPGVSGGQAQNPPERLSASLVEGTCETPDNTPLFALSNLTPHHATGTFRGTSSALGILKSETDVSISLSALLETPHAIVIGESGSSVACGDIGGFTGNANHDDDISIGLQPIGDSGIFGIAELEAEHGGTEIELKIAAPYQ